MARRNVYGNDWSENGWPMVDQGSCMWMPIPGAAVTIQVQVGQPAQVLVAFLADVHRHVQPLRDADTACWTETNSVDDSNHLSGTAVDVDWGDHPMGPAYAGWSPEQVAMLRRLLEYFEGTVFWGEDWSTPKDSMHFQMGYNTYGNPRTQDFIDRKVLTNGRSAFDGFDTTGPSAVAVLEAATGLDVDTCTQILPTLRDGLLLAQCDNVNRIAMFIAQTREESANYNTTVEYGRGRGKPYYPYCGRTWIQITWESNYADFGQWCVEQGLIDDPNLFVNNPELLADMRWAGVGAAWYWTVQRPGINAMCDRGDIVGVTEAINGGDTGLDVRTQYWNQARAQGDSLLALIQEDEMAGVNVDGLNRFLDAMGLPTPDEHIYRDDDSAHTNLIDRLKSVASQVMEETVENEAKNGDPGSVEKVKRVAEGRAPVLLPDWAVARAKAVLAEIEAQKKHEGTQ